MIEYGSGEVTCRLCRQIIECAGNVLGCRHFKRRMIVQHLPLAFSFECPFRLTRRLVAQHVFEGVKAIRCKSRVLQIHKAGIVSQTLRDDRIVLAVYFNGFTGFRPCGSSPVFPLTGGKIHCNGLLRKQTADQRACICEGAALFR